MMITGKIIEKAEEEEEDSDDQKVKNETDDVEEDYDFDQYKNIDDEAIDGKKIAPSPFLIPLLREKNTKKKSK